MSRFLLKSGATVGPIKDKSGNEERDAAVSTSGNRKPAPDEKSTAPSQNSWLENSSLKSSSTSFSISSGKDSGSNTTATKEEDNYLPEESFDTILDRIKHGEKGKISNIRFLSAISALAREAEENGLGEAHLPHSKAHLAEHIMMLMVDLPEQSVPNATLICAMYAIQNLSKIKPPLPQDMESAILRFALQGVLSLEVEDTNSHSQALYKTCSDTLQAMLKGMLGEEPTTGHLLFILEHVNFWIKSRDPKERARAQKVSTALLQHAVLSLHLDVKEVKNKIMKEILKLETGMEATDLLQGFHPSQDELILEDIEDTEETW